MTVSRFQKLVNDLKAQFLPDGRIELFEGGQIEMERFIYCASSTRQTIVETGDSILITKKIGPKLFVEISANKVSYNIGILKRVSAQISEELRKNTLMTVN
jgi:hypothetical protein